MRHLEHRQLLLATPVALQDAAAALLRQPGVEQRDAILAEQAGKVVAAVWRHQPVVGLQAGGKALRLRPSRVGEVAHPDLAAVEQRVGEAVAAEIDEADDLREAARRVLGGNLGKQLERAGVKGLDAARGVVLRDDDASVLRDRAADRVARLQHAADDRRLQQVDLGQPAVPAEDVGMAPVAREHHRRVRQVAETADAGVRLPLRGVDEGHVAAAAFDDDAEVAGTAQGRRGAAGEQQE
ncbi:MAG: hypothetical protein AW08_02521 [Candidatus Accumulibacter adjunctus]|uniref:Uncharacterized protein n=1 Tax=Candidatus Accumulibacter adjunctus TaxID=1454001 RepID=A0A011MVK5_9PROT|nr:MAG: hypothetical protein AW08_02521 [Candidatus Accumulibacter adjunctus]